MSIFELFLLLYVFVFSFVDNPRGRWNLNVSKVLHIGLLDYMIDCFNDSAKKIRIFPLYISTVSYVIRLEQKSRCQSNTKDDNFPFLVFLISWQKIG